ncbi:Pyrroline-5-carboxylate reductase 3 [Zootermopsis nevadensis]|uniref:Pyrroline-5-carboxylate reductase 3 n=1 Tax=Zootermopsis nevadensis TaxID=136037 RepID=A0A067RJI9_ZOONE|nr:Pyrroline-5-carboxylate reductase 3 [Zootermopsis nevadensis]
MEQKCNVGLPINVGFIGAGNMAKAIGEGLTHSGMIKPSQLYISAPSDRNLETWKALGAHTSHNNGWQE